MAAAQFDAAGSLPAVAIAICLPMKDAEKADPQGKMEAFPNLLLLQKRRRLLLADKAAILTPRAMEEPGIPRNCQINGQALLPRLVICQSEPCELMRGTWTQKLLRRIIASCCRCTRKPKKARVYIGYGLKHIDWKAGSSIERKLFPARHDVTGNMSRRINSFCNRLLLAVLAPLLGAPPAIAGDLFLDPSLKAQETYVSNPTFSTAPGSPSDEISELIPSLVMRSISKSLMVNTNVSLDAIHYLHHSEPSQVLPNGGIDALLEAVDGHLYIDAAAVAAQSAPNVFAATSQDPSTYNKFTAENYRFSPYLKGQLPGGLLYLVRSDNGWLRAAGNGAPAAADSRLARQSGDIDSLPRPFGWNLHVESAYTAYTDSSSVATRESLARLILKAAVDAELVLGLRGGIEKEDFLTDTGGRALYGAGFEWRPSDRADVQAVGERRFFGTQWNYEIKDQTSRVGINFSGGRDVATTAEAVFSLPVAGGGLPGMLDAMLLPSMPDPIDRARAVQDLLSQQKLPDTFASATQVYNGAPMLVTSNKAAFTVLGRIDALSLSLYNVRTSLPSSILSPAVLAAAAGALEQTQKGAALTLTHHLAALTSLSASANASVVDGLGVSSGSQTRQSSVLLQLNHSLSPTTEVVGGARMQEIGSNVALSARSKSAFVGVGHRF